MWVKNVGFCNNLQKINRMSGLFFAWPQLLRDVWCDFPHYLGRLKKVCIHVRKWSFSRLEKKMRMVHRENGKVQQASSGCGCVKKTHHKTENNHVYAWNFQSQLCPLIVEKVWHWKSEFERDKHTNMRRGLNVCRYYTGIDFSFTRTTSIVSLSNCLVVTPGFIIKGTYKT